MYLVTCLVRYGSVMLHRVRFKNGQAGQVPVALHVFHATIHKKKCTCELSNLWSTNRNFVLVLSTVQTDHDV